ncbi:MAG: hypothetical protein KatS3mg075_501 [Meiothermus sp.]|nr:MAG: hypothetical protein KatS3mg075_501 [Meiothermus sp.]
MPEVKANRKEKRLLQQKLNRMQRALEKGKTPLGLNVGIQMRHAYRIVRNGEVVESYGWDDER